ncbi:hypothetical protein GCM10009727_39260 [Actinomadura napierensis]|uniref:Uncharacterized protein n=1 Tax=Actinomadura napierensis TaxID=267854 RepID=A0ABP5L909_9ACTN
MGGHRDVEGDARCRYAPVDAVDRGRDRNVAVGDLADPAGVRPQTAHRADLSTDPQFVDKVRDAVGLYLNPPDNALVLAADEKSQMQAIDLLSRRITGESAHTWRDTGPEPSKIRRTKPFLIEGEEPETGILWNAAQKGAIEKSVELLATRFR